MFTCLKNIVSKNNNNKRFLMKKTLCFKKIKEIKSKIKLLNEQRLLLLLWDHDNSDNSGGSNITTIIITMMLMALSIILVQKDSIKNPVFLIIICINVCIFF